MPLVQRLAPPATRRLGLLLCGPNEELLAGLSRVLTARLQATPGVQSVKWLRQLSDAGRRSLARSRHGREAVVELVDCPELVDYSSRQADSELAAVYYLEERLTAVLAERQWALEGSAIWLYPQAES